MDVLNNKYLISLLIFASSFLAIFWSKKLILSRLIKFSQKTDTKLDDLFTDLLSSIKIFFIFALSLLLSVYFINLSPYIDGIVSNIIFVLFIVQLAITGTRAIRFFIEHYILHKMNEDASNAAIIGIAIFATKFLFYVVLLLLTLNNFGIDVTALIAGLGVGGIAIALAVQNILADLFASFTIILDKPFLVGDFIIVGEHMGTVEKIGIKTTRLKSLSGEQLIFPNGQLLQGQIRNFKRMQERRIVYSIGVTYQTSLEKIKLIPKIISEIIEKQDKARLERTHFKAYGDFSLNFETVYWVEDSDFKVYMDIQENINLAIFERFQKEGIEFAYPTQTIYNNVSELRVKN
jgi:small-conductance mechanosensitive channel